jgi:hypothetical protein
MCDVYMVLGEVTGQNSVLLEPLHVQVLDRTPWPPPIQLQIQSVGVQSTPPPWPFITNDTMLGMQVNDVQLRLTSVILSLLFCGCEMESISVKDIDS